MLKSSRGGHELVKAWISFHDPSRGGVSIQYFREHLRIFEHLQSSHLQRMTDKLLADTPVAQREISSVATFRD